MNLVRARGLRWSLIFSALLLAACYDNCSALDIRVIADRVNIRSRPDENSEVVGQASSGNILVTEKDLTGDWVEIMAPSWVNLWIHSELVQDGEVSASKAQVRVGRGISYRSVGTLEKGEKVKVLEDCGEWLKIASTSACRVWVSAKYVRPASEPYEEKKAVLRKPIVESVPKTASAAGQPVVMPVVRKDVAGKPLIKQSTEPVKVQAGPGPARMSLVESKDQGVTVHYEGVIRPSGFVWRRPSKYRLVRYDDGGYAMTICYVFGNDAHLASLEGRYLVVDGKEYWIQGVRYPVVEIKQIVQQSTSSFQRR